MTIYSLMLIMTCGAVRVYDYANMTENLYITACQNPSLFTTGTLTSFALTQMLSFRAVQHRLIHANSPKLLSQKRQKKGGGEGGVIKC